MTKTISEKNTKTEIIEAYNEVLAKLKEQKTLNQQAVKKEAEIKESLSEAWKMAGCDALSGPLPGRKRQPLRGGGGVIWGLCYQVDSCFIR